MNNKTASADLLTVDVSLSRGLAKRAVREASSIFDEQVARAIAKMDDKRLSLKRRYRLQCHAIRTAFKDAITFERETGTGKNKETQFFCWGTENDRITAILLFIPYRPVMFYDFTLFSVSRHATERIFERMNSTEIFVVQDELARCHILTAALLESGYDVEKQEKGIPITTPHGHAIIKQGEDVPLVVVTWIPAKPGKEDVETEEEAKIWQEVLDLFEQNHVTA